MEQALQVTAGKNTELEQELQTTQSALQTTQAALQKNVEETGSLKTKIATLESQSPNESAFKIVKLGEARATHYVLNEN